MREAAAQQAQARAARAALVAAAVDTANQVAE